MEESGRPRSPWKREFVGSNPAFPTENAPSSNWQDTAL